METSTIIWIIVAVVIVIALVALLVALRNRRARAAQEEHRERAAEIRQMAQGHTPEVEQAREEHRRRDLEQPLRHRRGEAEQRGRSEPEGGPARLRAEEAIARWRHWPRPRGFRAYTMGGAGRRSALGSRAVTVASTPRPA